MKGRFLLASLLLASLSLCLLNVSRASAAIWGVDYIELPNEGGVTVNVTDPIGNPFASVTVPGETVTLTDFPDPLSNLVLPAGFLTPIGIINAPGTTYTITIFEDASRTTISDQIFLEIIGIAQTRVTFKSDPADFLPPQPDLTQFNVILNYDETADPVQLAPLGNVNGDQILTSVLSDVESAVPEPASLIVWSLLGLSFGGATWWRRRKHAA